LREEENLLKVIAIMFIRQNFEHISITTGGFKDTIKYISANEIEYVRDEVLQSERITQNKEEWTAELITSKVQSLLNWGKQVAADYMEKEKTMPIANEKANANSVREHGESPKSAFTLDDEEFDDFQLDINDEQENLMKLEDLKKLDESVRIFSAQLEATYRENGSSQTKQRAPDTIGEKRYIVIGSNFIMSIKPHPTMLGYGLIVWKRTLRQLLRISYNKEQPNRISFFLKGHPNTLSYADSRVSSTGESKPPSFQDVYTMPQSTEFVKFIQENMANFKKKKQQQANESK